MLVLVLLQCMTLTEACAGFRRHQVREAIQATVRAWAKRIAKDKTPVYRDPVRVLANFALATDTDEERLWEVARICPCALVDKCKADADVLDRVVDACKTSAVAEAAVQELLSDERAHGALDADTRARLQGAVHTCRGAVHTCRRAAGGSP